MIEIQNRKTDNKHIMDIRYLEQDENDRSRQLYETAFPEDSMEFVDYYYSEKCKDNEILVMEDEDGIVSMIHLNPYTISMHGEDAKVHYVVAVATDENHRMEGHMRSLMEQAFYDLYQAGEPFAFLTPANPDYYYSCGFEYWDNQIALQQDQDTIWNGRQRLVAAVPADCDKMAQFSNETLAGQFDLFVKKDGAYYERLIKEQECDGGHLIVIKEVPEAFKDCSEEERLDAECVGGIFSMNHGAGLYFREPILAHSCTEEVVPTMMGRILNLKRFCQMQKSEEVIDLKVRIRDTMLSENEGCYHIFIDKNGGQITAIDESELDVLLSADEDAKEDGSMDIAELGQLLFNKMRIYINEVV